MKRVLEAVGVEKGKKLGLSPIVEVFPTSFNPRTLLVRPVPPEDLRSQLANAEVLYGQLAPHMGLFGL